MNFEWDETKRREVLAKRGIDLLDAALIFEGPVLEAPDPHKSEARIRALGVADGVAYVVV